MNTNSTRMFSWKTAIVLSFGVGLLAMGLSIVLQTRTLAAQNLPPDSLAPVVSTVPLAPSAVGSGSSYEAPGQPVRLIIPSIGVDANVQSVGLSWRGTGEMGVPTNFTDVGWYKDGPLPGMPGSAVIDGHLDGKNVREAVFYDLGKLQPGDVVEVVTKAGKTLQFRVVESKTYDYDAPTTDIFVGDASKARLNLITCAGDWMKDKKLYDKRIVVFTELVTTL